MAKLPYARFETTMWGQVIDAARAGKSGSFDEQQVAEKALNELCHRYWSPLYCFTRSRGFDHHESQDIIQEFFAAFLRRQALAKADPSKGRFRNFLLVSLKNFIGNWHEFRLAKKRDRRRELSISAQEFEEAEIQLADEAVDPFQGFQRRWAELILKRALSTLRAETKSRGRSEELESLFEFLCTTEPKTTYDELAHRLKVKPGQARLLVYRYRKRLGDCVREEIRQTVDHDNEVESELDELIETMREG